MARTGRIFSDNINLPHCTRPGVMIYLEDWRALCDSVSLEQRGRFVDSVMAFVQDGVLPDFSDEPVLRASWGFIKQKLLRDQDEYNYTIWKNRYVAYKRGLDNPLEPNEWLRQVTSDNESSPNGNGTGNGNGAGT